MSEFDFDDDNSDEAMDEKYDMESDEDTEDASETDMVKQEEEYTEIKEQMYQDKLANLKRQLKQLEDGVHPDYIKKLRKLEQNFQKRQILNDIFKTVEIERIERDYIVEREAAHKEYEDKKIELRENLICDLEEKKRIIEAERSSMDLTSDTWEVKTVTTRKLRRRPNDPLPVPDKRRKPFYFPEFNSPQLSLYDYLLDENEIMEDLKLMKENKNLSPSKRHDSCEGSSSDHSGVSSDIRVEDGKLYFDKKWFHRGQQVYYEGKEVGNKNSGVICLIGASDIWVKRTMDSNKIRIHLSQLQKGQITLRRRSA